MKVATSAESQTRSFKDAPRTDDVGLPELILERLPSLYNICHQLKVRRLDVFGSALRADFDPESSDMDFLVDLGSLPPLDYAATYFKLHEALQVLFGRSVDLLTPPALSNPYLRERIHSEMRQVYAS